MRCQINHKVSDEPAGVQWTINHEPWTLKYDNLTWRGCQDPKEIESQDQDLLCKFLISKNPKVSYFPVYEGLYSDNNEEQTYTSIILSLVKPCAKVI